jgi:hypothetical protein
VTDIQEGFPSRCLQRRDGRRLEFDAFGHRLDGATVEEDGIGLLRRRGIQARTLVRQRRSVEGGIAPRALRDRDGICRASGNDRILISLLLFRRGSCTDWDLRA